MKLALTFLKAPSFRACSISWLLQTCTTMIQANKTPQIYRCL